MKKLAAQRREEDVRHTMFTRDSEFHPREYTKDQSFLLFRKKCKLCASKDGYPPARSLSSEHDNLIKVSCKMEEWKELLIIF